MRKRWMFILPIGIVAIAVFGFVGGQLVKLLWNWLLPELFHFPQITFWQALGLLALCRILFGGLGRGGSSRSRMSQHMTPEERERFRQRMRARFGFRSTDGAGTL